MVSIARRGRSAVDVWSRQALAVDRISGEGLFSATKCKTGGYMGQLLCLTETSQLGLAVWIRTFKVSCHTCFRLKSLTSMATGWAKCLKAKLQRKSPLLSNALHCTNIFSLPPLFPPPLFSLLYIHIFSLAIFPIRHLILYKNAITVFSLER